MTASAFDLLARPIQQILWDLRWTELRPIQVTAIQEIQTSDHDALITARTAAGKTEAAFLPILSQLFTLHPSSVGAIYVGPLKALINDQFRRLDQLCERAEIAVHRWHGDVDYSRKASVLAKPSGVLLITPESLESLFVNRSSAISSLFGDLRYVVIDEIHSLVGRERGTQLRSLLFRLRNRIGHDFRIAALSATVGDNVDAYAHWIRPDQSQRVAHLYDAGEQKKVQFGIFAYHRDAPVERGDDRETLEAAEKDEETPEDLVHDIVKNFCGRKNLIFCNRREDVEWLADRLNEQCLALGRPPEFLVHHGALSREVREHTEQQMKEARPATTICSSTLELGIDIGNVATVGQLGPPWSVNSQVQRLGRSGRRDGEPQVMRVMLVERHRTASDKLVDRLYPRLLHAIAVTELMKEKWVEPPRQIHFDFSTLVQQILSALAESGGCQAARLFRILATEGAFRHIDQGTFAEVLRSLGRRQLIEQTPEGILILAPAGERVVHDRDFYSAFATEVELTVTHEGRLIGMLPAMFVPNVGDHVILAARRWQVSAIDERRREIQVRPARGRKPPRFTGREGEVHPRIRQTMLRVVTGHERFSYLNPAAAQMLEDARTVAREAGLQENRLIATGPSSCLWFTWTGTRSQQTLCLAAKQLSLDAADQEIAIEFDSPANEVFERCREMARHPLDAMALAKSAPVRIFRKFDELVDEAILIRGFAADGLDTEGASQCVKELVSCPPPGVEGKHSGFPIQEDKPAHDGVFLDGVLPGVDAGTPLSKLEFIAFDVETTGLMPVVARIVEIAAVRFHLDGTVIDTWHTLVDPGHAIPDEARAIHGITDAMVRGQPTEREAASRFLDFVGRSPALLVAHNASFDLGFVAAALLTNGLTLPEVRAICTLELAQTRLSSLAKCTLKMVACHLGLPNTAFHRAAADADILAAVLPRLIRSPPILKTAGDLIACCCPLCWDDGEVSLVGVPPRFAALAVAIEKRQRLGILYETRDGKLRDLLVTPFCLIHSRGREYLVAHCHIDQLTKTYRFDRIRRIKR